MNITVRDCMKLPAFSQATLVAGAKGLDHIVSSITVLEYADVSLISQELFINHEICITAFASIKDDVEKQCAVLRRLHELGNVAIVLYYIGIFMQSLDERLIATAEELGLPLICMPDNRLDFRYSEVINDVMGAIFQNRVEGKFFVSEMLECISQLQENRRTISNVLRMLSDRLRCSFLLADHDFSLKGAAMWPMASQWDVQPLLTDLKDFSSVLNDWNCFHMNIDQKEVVVSCAPITYEKMPPMYLLSLDEMEATTEFQVKESAELISLFLNIWDYNFGEINSDMLVKAILHNEPFVVQEFIKRHNIDVKQLETMWILRESDHLESSALKQASRRHVMIAKKVMQEQRLKVLVSAYQKTVVMLFDTLLFAELEVGFEEMFLEEIMESDKDVLFMKFQKLTGIKDIQNAYALMERCYPAIKIIFPLRRIFTIQDLHFVDNCIRIIEAGESTLVDSTYPLTPLRLLNNYDRLIETLSVYLLDADSNMKQASSLLFLHQNTVKYRINRIRSCFDYDIFKMPAASALYYAVAIVRLMDRWK